MNKKSFWQSDWFTGLLVSLLFFGLASTPLLQSIETKAYDWGVKSSQRAPSDKISIIAIDDESINNLGRWPWSRDLHAQMIDQLTEAGAKVIGYTALFSEPQVDQGYALIEDMYAHYLENDLGGSLSGLEEAAPQTEPELENTNEATANTLNSEELTNIAQEAGSQTDATLSPIQQLGQKIEDALFILDVDQTLSESLANSKNVVLPMVFYLGEPDGNPDQPMPEYLSKYQVIDVIDNVNAQGSGKLPVPSYFVEPIIPVIGQQTSGVGHLNYTPDVDGGVRSEPLILDYYNEYYPSLSLMIAAKSLNLSVDDMKVRLGEGVKLGKLEIKTDENLQMRTFFYSPEAGQERAFQVDSFFDVAVGKIPASKYKDKIVIIGATAAGIGNSQVTPVSPDMSPILTLAHTVSSLLQEDFFVEPSWSTWAWLSAMLFVAVLLMFVLPKLKANPAAILTLLVFAGFIAAHYILMTSQGMWLQFMVPAAMLVVGYLVLTTKRFLVTERGKKMSDDESAESNRMLGLAYQGQGQLDMAFEKFRKCPKDDAIAEVLYNLAADFERKRQFGKSTNVYQYIFDFNSKFRDVSDRVDRSKQMEQTVILGGGGGGSAAGTLVLDRDDVEKPMLGRYQVEKELGKGAMGIVYLGSDPKIGRTVAIKTMALAQEFEGDDLDEVKERFFREAETAGRLNHPNIVTIHDAGEEQDLAYIAMEFLKGKDLEPYTKIDNLLEMETVFTIVKECADALDYAHKQNVVHRDIKPANIMYDPQTKVAKVTDFGIARLTDNSKTKTGMVLGTPTFMSPEQVEGKKVDGRSDLFSLGVMLFQLLTGKLPFTGDSMASLMYAIANTDTPNILEYNAKLPKLTHQVIDKALQKDESLRYQTGKEMAADLQSCIDKLG